MDNLLKRIQTESKSVRPITEQDLICRDCKFSGSDKVSTCKAFDIKPNSVFIKGFCRKYQKR